VTGVRADWRLADLLDETSDPFEAVIYSSGLQVNLDASDEELDEALKRALRTEGRLWDIGLKCSLKENGQDCLSCTQASTDPQAALTRLCEVGKDGQTLARRADERQTRRRAPLRELAASVEGFTELGHLEPEYDELLTAVGM
jgi:hypothetical protein